MKELSIEDKAKAYDEAIEKAKIWQEHLYDVNDKDYADELNYIFPELAESEDERIRKELIAMVKLSCTNGDDVDKKIAWIEKQGEHDNFLSKIQVGDKVTRNEDGAHVNLSQLNRVANKDEKQGEQKSADKVEPKFKEGDYIERKDGLGCHAKIIFVGGNVYGCEKLIYSEDESPFFEFMFKNQDEFQISSNFKQKPAWSEEDERMWSQVINEIEAIKSNSSTVFEKNIAQDKIDFLKSFKDRIQPQQQEWSEEDEKMCNDIIQFIEKGWTDNGKSHLIPWLKSLRHRLQWKPSDEQMYSLNWVANVLLKQDGIVEKETSKILDSLYNDLKKLKE